MGGATADAVTGAAAGAAADATADATTVVGFGFAKVGFATAAEGAFLLRLNKSCCRA